MTEKVEGMTVLLSRKKFYVYDGADRLQFYVKPDGSVVAYDWDGNGNMIARTEGNQTTQFEYDYDNRLIKITYPDGSIVQFGYDGLGRRVTRQEGNNVRYFFYDGDRIIAEREGSSWVVRYLLGLRPSGFVANGQIRVYHADRLGSVRWVTDGSQNIVVSYVYEGFGKIVGQNGGGGGPYQFCGLWGYRNDQDAGLIHVGARYYEFETGRWVQKDLLIGFVHQPVSLNLYIYCLNDPTNNFDPSGYIAWRVFTAWISVIAEHAISNFMDDRFGIPISPPLDRDAWFGPPTERGAAWIDWGFGTIPSLVGIEIPLPFNLAKSTFFKMAEYAAEQFWEAREKTGGVLHKFQAIRSGVGDLW